ncbi:unnamed protein product [Didymodactylos carnosus]|uniref:G-protein coupled receptors family 1 profile domain-containing protein n=1 Tax=Didymodactylos carnosus TaxID=1234261 RepID=A0A815T8R3_9BILA|nr:unnamed protein product [Didymodactylos carnosus]CAF4362202.1 unnamed protein product [Didymodactylos carnosus]
MDVQNQTQIYDYLNHVHDDLLLNSKAIESAWLLYTFVFLSTTEIIFGVIGNGLVIYIFLIRSTTKTSHNYFTANLALSDFILCLITIPLNIYRNLNIYMAFPPVFCHLAEVFPAVNVYVSSSTITAIAVDRYLTVKYPHRHLVGPLVTTVTLIFIWIISIAASSPLFVYSTSSKVYDDSLISEMIAMNCESINTNNDGCQKYHLEKYQNMHVCLEKWPSAYWRLTERIATLIFQCIFPILIIGVTNYQTALKLKEHVTISSPSAIHDNNLQYHTKTATNTSTYLPLVLIICMISAVTNPFLYGYFNESLKNEFLQLFSRFICCRVKR